MNNKFLCVLKLVIGLAFLVGASATALGEEFYQGKTIQIVVGFGPGGGYDIYSRAVARHMSRYIPGNPTLVVQNMSGDGSLVTAHYIYNKAKPDGLTVGVWNSGLVLGQALGDRSVKFAGDKFGWIGASGGRAFHTCGIMAFTGLKTLKDVLNSKKPIKMGGTQPGIETNDIPRILNLTLGTRFDVISGYGGTSTINAFMQRRELEGVCYGWESMKVTARALLDAKGDDKLIPFITYGDSQDPEVRDLPRLNEVIKGKENLAIFNAWLQSGNFRRPFTLPPGTPKERLSILRKAYKATLEDAEFLAEAKRSNLIINYVSGEEIDKLVVQILAISPKTKEMLQFLIK